MPRQPIKLQKLCNFHNLRLITRRVLNHRTFIDASFDVIRTLNNRLITNNFKPHHRKFQLPEKFIEYWNTYLFFAIISRFHRWCSFLNTMCVLTSATNCTRGVFCAALEQLTTKVAPSLTPQKRRTPSGHFVKLISSGG